MTLTYRKVLRLSVSVVAGFGLNRRILFAHACLGRVLRTPGTGRSFDPALLSYGYRLDAVYIARLTTSLTLVEEGLPA